jgi:NAD(P)H dehydrogenase (quinone)
VGTDVRYENLDSAGHLAALTAAGLPEGTAQFLVAMDANIAAGDLDGPTGEISRLIGRPTTPLIEGLRAGAKPAAA